MTIQSWTPVVLLSTDRKYRYWWHSNVIRICCLGHIQRGPFWYRNMYFRPGRSRIRCWLVLISFKSLQGFKAVLGSWFRIRKIRMFFGLPEPEPDPEVRDTNPDPLGCYFHCFRCSILFSLGFLSYLFLVLLIVKNIQQRIPYLYQNLQKFVVTQPLHVPDKKSHSYGYVNTIMDTLGECLASYYYLNLFY
jgi:hypothetical protein